MKENATIGLGIALVILTAFTIFFVSDTFNQQVFIDSDPEATDFLNHPLLFDENISFNHLKNQVNIGYRYPGTLEINETRVYITSELIKYNWRIFFHNFTFNGIDVSNILAFPENSNNETLKSTLLLGAHYDTRIKADRDQIYSNRDLPILGANDAASGVAVLIEMARIYRNASNISLLFIDAEDQGSAISGWNYIEGSKEFAKPEVLSGYFPDGKNSISNFILFDMIGDKDLTIYKEGNSNANIMNEIWNIGHYLGYTSNFIDQYKYTMTDDHVPFKNAGISVVDLIDFDFNDENGHNLHHTINDNLDHVSAESLKIIGQTIELWLRMKDIWSIN